MHARMHAALAGEQRVFGTLLWGCMQVEVRRAIPREEARQTQPRRDRDCNENSGRVFIGGLGDEVTDGTYTPIFSCCCWGGVCCGGVVVAGGLVLRYFGPRFRVLGLCMHACMHADVLRDFFSRFGELTSANVMVDRETNRPRGTLGFRF